MKSKQNKTKTKSTHSGIEDPFYVISAFYSFELFYNLCKLYKTNNANDSCP